MSSTIQRTLAYINTHIKFAGNCSTFIKLSVIPNRFTKSFNHTRTQSLCSTHKNYIHTQKTHIPPSLTQLFRLSHADGPPTFVQKPFLLQFVLGIPRYPVNTFRPVFATVSIPLTAAAGAVLADTLQNIGDDIDVQPRQDLDVKPLDSGLTIGSDTDVLTDILAQRREEEKQLTSMTFWEKCEKWWKIVTIRPGLVVKHIIRMAQLAIMFLPPLSAGLALILADLTNYYYQYYHFTRLSYPITIDKQNSNTQFIYHRPDGISSFYQKWWLWLKWTLRLSGPTFIKLGQYLSSRPDILSSSICEILSDLQSGNHTHSWDDTCAQFDRELGPNWSDFIIIDDKTPIGSGSIAQVYRGVLDIKYYDPVMAQTEELKAKIIETSSLEQHASLTQDGKDYALNSDELHQLALDELQFLMQYKERTLHNTNHLDLNPQDIDVNTTRFIPIAIKVLHPGAISSITRDLQLLFFLSEVVESLPLAQLQCASPTNLVTEFARLMLLQLDLRQEQRNLQLFQRNFGHTLLDNSIMAPIFPTPIISRKSCLIESYHSGIPMFTFIDRHRSRYNKSLETQSVDWEPKLQRENEELEKLGELYDLLKNYDEQSINSTEFEQNIIYDKITNDIKIMRDACNLTDLRTIQQEHILTSMSETQYKFITSQVANVGLRIFLMMLFSAGTFHADLHSGNIIVDLGYDLMKKDELCDIIEQMRNLSYEQNHIQQHNIISDKQQSSFNLQDHPKHYSNNTKIIPENTNKSSKLQPSQVTSLQNSYFSQPDCSPGTIFPQEVFNFIHPCSTYLHESSNIHPELNFKQHMYRLGIPQMPRKPRLVCLDAGMATALDERDKNNFNDLFFNIAIGNGYNAAAMMIQRAKPVHGSPQQISEFNEKINAMQADLLKERESLSQMKQRVKEYSYSRANRWERFMLDACDTRDAVSGHINRLLDHFLHKVVREKVFGLGDLDPVNSDEDTTHANVTHIVKPSEIPLETIEINGKDINLYALPFNPQQTKENRRAFIKTIGDLIVEMCNKQFNLSSTDAVHILHTLTSSAQQNCIRLDTSFVGVIVATLCIEGVGRSIDENVDVIGPGLEIITATRIKEAEARIKKACMKCPIESSLVAKDAV